LALLFHSLLVEEGLVLAEESLLEAELLSISLASPDYPFLTSQWSDLSQQSDHSQHFQQSDHCQHYQQSDPFQHYQQSDPFQHYQQSDPFRHFPWLDQGFQQSDPFQQSEDYHSQP
jgi:hypothetical protein